MTTGTDELIERLLTCAGLPLIGRGTRGRMIQAALREAAAALYLLRNSRDNARDGADEAETRALALSEQAAFEAGIDGVWVEPGTNGIALSALSVGEQERAITDDGNAPGWNPDPTFNGPPLECASLSVEQTEAVAWVVHDPAEGDYLTKSLNAAAHSEHGYTALVPASALSTLRRELDEARATLKYFSDLHEQEHKRTLVERDEARAERDEIRALYGTRKTVDFWQERASQARADAIEAAAKIADIWAQKLMDPEDMLHAPAGIASDIRALITKEPEHHE